ncbi:MAG: S1C family serine protease [Pirellulaceae bacterium]
MPESQKITSSPAGPAGSIAPEEPDRLPQTGHRGLVPAWKRRLGASVLTILVLVLAMAFWRAISHWRTYLPIVPPADRSAVTAEEDPQRALKLLSVASQHIAERIRRAVVRVEATDIHLDAADDEIAQLFGSSPPAFGQGSGVIVDADGYVLTNYHVIRGAREISVVVESTRRFPAIIVGSDALTDLAVLRIDANGLETITWGDSNKVQVSAFVWAIGSPFGLEGSVSFGIVSAKNRDTLGSSPFQAFLQTDAAVNPGNSGGPLVDAEGKVVGINTAILGRSFQGISFAIPSNTARDIHHRLKQSGHVARGWLGVSLDRLTEQRAAQLMIEPGLGVYVVSVAGDAANPARQAGIRPGDVLTRWNDEPVDDPIEFSRLVAQSPIGSHAQVTAIRDGREMKLPLVVGERPR